MTESICKEWYLNNLGTGNDKMAAVMMTVSLVLDALGIARYSSKKSKRTYDDHCKIGLLVLKAATERSYRDFCELLWSMPGVMAAGGITKVPDPSTLRKFLSRLTIGLLDRVIGETARMLCGPSVIAAFDSTGYSMSCASRHYVTRMKQMGAVKNEVKDYAKVTLLGDVSSKAIISCGVFTSGTADVKAAVPVIENAAKTEVTIAEALGDKGHDSEPFHRDVRRILGDGVDVWIPVREYEPKSQKSEHLNYPKGWYRRKCHAEIRESMYSYRSQIETINSMIKRKMGDVVYGKSMESIRREVMFIVISHNVRLLLGSGWVI